MCVCECECVCVCVCVNVHACVCVRANVCVLGGEGSLVFASTAVVVSSMDGHVSDSDYLTGFCKQLLPPYRCHTSLKNV